jgi:hypothetical protein
MKKPQLITILTIPFILSGCQPVVYSQQPPGQTQIVEVNNQNSSNSSSGNVTPPPLPPPTPTHPKVDKAAKAVVVKKAVQNHDNKESQRAHSGTSAVSDDNTSQ